MGLETEEGVLEFLRGLEGQWCSRRKKRKYVDAGDFGDALPIGWKLLLGLRRRDGRVWVYCRRIIRLLSHIFISLWISFIVVVRDECLWMLFSNYAFLWISVQLAMFVK